ncbi:FtsX-like permease family protein [Limibacillus sp. MBR-115]|uniref:ABC transporter permease n=1 Tax=Limibacillus sp. MBR-115 TaxID=3156465 RepID=UPI0033998508
MSSITKNEQTLSLLGSLAQPFRLARRELRGGLKGFRIFIACLALGVATIAGVGSLSEAMLSSLRTDGRALLGGDVEVRLIHREASAAEESWFRDSSKRLSRTADLRTMARSGLQPDGTTQGRQRLVELKAVDEAYPLYGAFKSDPQSDLPDLLAYRDGRWGALVDTALLVALEIEAGDALRIGNVDYEVRGTVKREPDRAARAFTLGPRVLVGLASLEGSGLLQPGSLAYHHYRLEPRDGLTPEQWIDATKERFPEAGWRIVDVAGGAPGMERFVERVTLFMTLVGLTALLVGGVGVANAVRSYLGEKRKVIATLKALGASARQIFLTYLLQILAIAGLGIAIGLAIGAAVPLAVGPLLADRLNLSSLGGLYPQPLLLAALFGLLVTLSFSLWPLGRAQAERAAGLFREQGSSERRLPAPWVVIVTLMAAAALAGLAIITSTDRLFAAGFVAGSVGSLLVFRLAAAGVMAAARALPRFRTVELRLAVASLHRPGASTASVVVSLGLGLTVLVAIALIEGNLSRQVTERIPEEAPGFYFIDIQPEQAMAFEETVRSVPGVERMQRVPMLRGRITAVNRVPPDQLDLPSDVAWVFQGDRGLTWSREMPPDSPLVLGEWWTPDYNGPPLVSLDHDVVEALGLVLGDTLTVNILGRNVEVEIANSREIDWQDLQIDFVMVFSPGLLESAPQSQIATVTLDPDQEDYLERLVVNRFPNVSAIRVKEALAQAAEFFGKVAVAIRATAGLTLLSGVLVLAGAFAAGHRRRVYDSVVLKVLGATRRRVATSFLLQYGLLGLITAAIAAAIGSLAGYVVVTQVMKADFIFLPMAVFPTALLAAALTLGIGFVGTWRALSIKPAPLLRNE